MSLYYPLAAEQGGRGTKHKTPSPIRKLGAPCILGPQLLLQLIVTKNGIFGLALIRFKLHEIWQVDSQENH